MRVLFDSQIFCSQRFGGISRYFTSLARELSATSGVTPRIVAPVHINAYLGSLPSSIVEGREVPALRRLWPAAYLASSLLSRAAKNRFRPDVVHQTFYYQKRSSGGPPTVTTVYDLIHEKFPDGLRGAATLSRWKRARVLEADHVICISHNTKADVLNVYGIPEEKVSVVHLAQDPLRPQAGLAGSDYRTRLFGADEPYLLFVGVRVGYKNFDRLLDAFGKSTVLKDRCRLLCFGGGPFTPAELEKMQRYGVSQRVVQTQGSDVELADAYAHALVMVYPSRYEGFGLPPLEAMSLSCPVACSNAGSLPEVVGSAAVLFDPEDEEAQRHALETLVESSAERERLRVLGRHRCESFSWQKCAAETLSVYQQVAARSER